jgi:L-seryl-tRNA(Ser) seleniumtransferase
VPVFEDQGSGVLIDLRPFGLPYEPTVGESIAAGVALVSCSGDKLLGGPQAGILAGRADIIRHLKQHPLARVLRLDKMTLAALEVTLRAYMDPERALREIPTLRMLTMTLDEVRTRAEDLAARIGDACSGRFDIDVRESIARAGGGALPMADIPTAVVAIAPVTGSVTEFERRLRLGEPSVVARIKDDRLMLDPRTLSDDEIALVADAVVRVCCDGC